MYFKILAWIGGLNVLTHWGLVTSYCDSNLGQHWLRQWLVTWRHQAITWTDVDLSSERSSNIHLRARSQKIPQPSITGIICKIKYLKFHSNFPGANELILHVESWCSFTHIRRCFSTGTEKYMRIPVLFYGFCVMLYTTRWYKWITCWIPCVSNFPWTNVFWTANCRMLELILWY